jgi:hypothetical protein
LYICFKFNDDCKAFADLQITPEPDLLARFYMLWSPIDVSTEESTVKAQKIPTINRNGFVVLEWGGMEIGLNALTDLN